MVVTQSANGGHRLLNSRHQVSLELPVDGQPLAVSGRPSSVFTFKLADTTVTCMSRRLRYVREVLRAPSRSHLLTDERFFIDSLPARQLRFELPRRAIPGSVPAYLILYVIETYRALYVFLCRFNGTIDLQTDLRLKQTVDSFRSLESPTEARPDRASAVLDDDQR